MPLHHSIETMHGECLQRHKPQVAVERETETEKRNGCDRVQLAVYKFFYGKVVAR